MQWVQIFFSWCFLFNLLCYYLVKNKFTFTLAFDCGFPGRKTLRDAKHSYSFVVGSLAVLIVIFGFQLIFCSEICLSIFIVSMK